MILVGGSGTRREHEIYHRQGDNSPPSRTATMTQLTEPTEVLTDSADSDDSSDVKLSDLATGSTAGDYEAGVGIHKHLWRMTSGVQRSNRDWRRRT